MDDLKEKIVGEQQFDIVKDVVTVKNNSTTIKEGLSPSFLIGVGFVIVLIFSLGFFVGNYFQNNEFSLNENTLIKVVYAGTECDLRSTNEIKWIPNMIIQQDSNGNIFGSPNCVPINRITGERVKIN